MNEFKPEFLIEKIEDLESIMKLPEGYLHEKVVLGIDIYRYSQYPLVEQIYIPVLFNSLYSATVANVMDSEAFFFDTYEKTYVGFQKKFINTGDGGFQIFDNPIQAIVFSLYFQLNVIRFNSGSNTNGFKKKLHSVVDSIELRYSITLDFLYSYKSNYFGPAIINNARILSKDSLNRMLVDKNVIRWLRTNINSVENLVDIDKGSFVKTNYFKSYNKGLKSTLFERSGAMKSVDSLKIGTLTAKFTTLEIYNLHIQALVNLAIDKHEYNRFIITIGNLNTSGIQ